MKRKLFICFIIFVNIFAISSMVVPINLDRKYSVDYFEEIDPDNLFFFSDIVGRDFTCTGITYDSYNDSFWVADYGAEKGDITIKPKLYEFTKDFSVKKDTILLSSINDYKTVNLQGIAYDSNNDTLWIVTGKEIIEISKTGQKLKTIDIGNFRIFIPNGIAYNCDDDSIWILYYYCFLVNYDKKGNIKKIKVVNYKNQDHLMCFDGEVVASIGADYKGDRNYVYGIYSENHEHGFSYKVLDSFAIEGICFVDGALYVVNDGAFHDAKIGRSYVAVYNIGDENKKNSK